VAASSIQIAFYFETGGEIKWGAAGNFAHDPTGYKLLLSGGLQAVLVAFVIMVVARAVSDSLNSGVEVFILKVAKTFSTPSSQSLAETEESMYDEPSSENLVYSGSTRSEEGIDILSRDPESLGTAPHLLENDRTHHASLLLRQLLLLAPVVTISILLAVRPRSFPYGHMSSSLPFTLFDIWSPSSQDMCQAGARGSSQFPLPDLISPAFWEQPTGTFVGWMPSINDSDTEQQDVQLPSWLPRQPVPGFNRWYHHPHSKDLSLDSEEYRHEGRKGSRDKHHHKHHHKEVTYDPVTDPLRISNLDGNILAPIAEAMQKNEVRIKHVVIISLESTRKDVFPLKKDSNLYDVIMKTHGSDDFADEVGSALAKLTKNAELLTGESSGFDLDEKPDISGKRTWRNLDKRKGGLNVVGAVTGSTSTFKSMLGSHCGVQPLPIDFTVEAGGHIYQPCLPSILKLFNLNKEAQTMERRSPENKEENFRSRPWKSVFIQSITDQFDRQDDLNTHIGFSQVITKETILDPSAKHYPPTEPESNYFGFPESQVKPYLLDVFRKAEETNERLFLSHFTSSTHHPWNTPEAAGQTVDYLKKRKWRSEHPLNKYLNTINYQDNWIGEVMDMLDELNIADQTLVVTVGDQ
jgi:hypothetical protein